jgi:RNA polymerase sigma-70 factor, ECF subfamily
LIGEGIALLENALRRGRPGIYQLQAAISAVHSEAGSHGQTRWREIVQLYDRLHAMSANPVYLVNRAAALSFADGPVAGLEALLPLEPEFEAYQPYFAAKADMLRRAGTAQEAKAAYQRAIALSRNASERAFLRERSAGL